MNLIPECRPVSPDLLVPLTQFFERITQTGTDRFFHPHPFTAEEAQRRVSFTGEDVYLVLLLDRAVAAYGMLRGWDEGYAIPSLGIAVDPSAQGRGYGRVMMDHLHAAAKSRDAKQVRLKVYADNTRAVALYRSLGYEFKDEAAAELVGFKSLEGC